MKLLGTFFIVLCLHMHFFGQRIDYKLIRDSLSQLSCGPIDSLTVVESRNALEAIDTTIISSNIDIYYHDLGWCYYRLYGVTNDTSFIRMMSLSYDKALSHNPKYSAVLWDKSFINYFFFKDCQKGKYYMDRFKEVTRKKYWNKEQMRKFSIDCE